MVDIPVKRYRVRRARNWLRRKLVRFPVRAGTVAGKWAKPDRDRFPPRSQADVPGLGRYEYSWLSQNVDFFNFAAKKHGIDDRARAVQVFITRANLENLITSNGVPRDIDFLLLDVAGNDYWFWETLECVSPRVVCIGYNAGLGPDPSVTVPCDDAFERFSKHPSGFFHGASLVALTALGKHKGYYLIGCDSTGTNAFYLRDDVRIEGVVPELTPREAFRPHANWLGRGISEAEQLEFMAEMPYEEV